VGVRPTLIASTFTSTLRDLRRRGVRTEAIRDGHFIELFRLLDERKLIKEAIPQILAHIAQKPEMGVLAAVEQLKLTPISLAELKAAIRKVIRQNPTVPERKIVGLVMSQVRGRAEAEQVVRTVRQLIKKKRSL
jgi:glutamyl-tRNA(Gln) amidotransferase subunit E